MVSHDCFFDLLSARLGLRLKEVQKQIVLTSFISSRKFWMSFPVTRNQLAIDQLLDNRTILMILDHQVLGSVWVR